MPMNDVEKTARTLLAAANAQGAPEHLSPLAGWSYGGRHWEGGMGGVALIVKGEEKRVLKFVLPEAALDQHSRELFLRECDNMRALHHPNIVEPHGAGSHDGVLFVTMEYCTGGSLSDLENVGKIPLPVDKALAITLQGLDGLEYAHHAQIPNVKLADGTFAVGHGLVHRDIKPSNLFLQNQGSNKIVKVGDYGLAKAYSLAGMSGLTHSRAVGGTLAFMPRQQLNNFLYAKPEVDVWAMAASLYWMLTGFFPRDGDASDPFRWIRETAPTPIRKRGVSIPDGIADVLDRALNDRAGLAFQSAAALREALRSA